MEARTIDGGFSLPDISVQDLQPDLDFYQDLMLPAQPEQESTPSADASPVAAEVSREDPAEPPVDTSPCSAEPYTVQVGAFNG